MAFTSPFTAVPGAVYTAAQWNTYGRDNINDLHARPAASCEAYHSASVSVSSGATTALVLDSEIHDTAGMHDLSTNTNRITVPSGLAGRYLALGCSLVSSVNNPLPRLLLRKNGTVIRQSRFQTGGGDLEDQTLEVWAYRDMAAGDYFDLAGNPTGAACNYGSSSAEDATRLVVIGPWPPS